MGRVKEARVTYKQERLMRLIRQWRTNLAPEELDGIQALVASLNEADLNHMIDESQSYVRSMNRTAKGVFL